ncbi:hypothetical protein F3N42_03290 [Marinihelvus fidelis]|uniref:Glycosyltransferase family 4 protein n=1 Tax=Marinihelvus fidelis TaxID=2613842 RepID=A0A5N0THP9_9GAMM|nr:hypothetical protein [Marinihelvus fidelis]KAA9133386.1 hypothetical protein F3N42_03290 [Marinihelvus fidelis]
MKMPVYFDIKKPAAYSRYLYNLVKCLDFAGHRVFFNPDKTTEDELASNRFTEMLLKEDIVSLAHPPVGDHFHVTENLLSPRYYDHIVLDRADTAGKNDYYVPITPHPAVFQFGSRVSRQKGTRRNQSVFMIGSMNAELYQRIENFPPFKTPNRYKICQHLLDRQLAVQFSSLDAFQDRLERQLDRHCVVLDSANFKIPRDGLLDVLARFDFYLACPGVYMPFSHNVAEAMSVGCIPVIHAFYAQLFHPGLKDGHTAVIYESLDELESKLQQIYRAPRWKIWYMRRKVERYYQRIMSPAAIARNFVSGRFTKIYMLSEQRSARLMREAQKRVTAVTNHD